jgi:hypothetical protein
LKPDLIAVGLIQWQFAELIDTSPKMHQANSRRVDHFLRGGWRGGGLEHDVEHEEEKSVYSKNCDIDFSAVPSLSGNDHVPDFSPLCGSAICATHGGVLAA